MSEPTGDPTSAATNPPTAETPKRKRGRPKGSKNKPANGANDDEHGTPRKRPNTKARSASPPPGEWTPAKRAAFMDRIIANGYKATNLDELGAELGLKKRQLVNQLAPGRKGSLRDKAVACAGEEGKNEKREVKADIKAAVE